MSMQIIRTIQNRIYEIRKERVMLDYDLAALYEVETKVFNQTVKRNTKRFPTDFMFQLTRREWNSIKALKSSQHIDDQLIEKNRSQIVTGSQKHRSRIALPYAFTEQGVAMLSGILNSDRAINMNIAIMRAFVEVRRVLLLQSDVAVQIEQIRDRIGEHDVQLSQIYDALENLLDEKKEIRKWEDRDRIGFRANR